MRRIFGVPSMETFLLPSFFSLVIQYFAIALRTNSRVSKQTRPSDMHIENKIVRLSENSRIDSYERFSRLEIRGSTPKICNCQTPVYRPNRAAFFVFET